MSNINVIVPERAADIGSFLVGRLLPFRKKRMIGPFIFIDHMGPIEMSRRENFDVMPHPHIGLSTLTFLFEGSIMHRDTLGHEIEIKPGAVNWMTAGKWVVHSERTPEYLRSSKKHMHGLQIWVALPKKLEQMEPEFYHIDAKAIPSWNEGNIEFKLIAGKAMGHESPVPVYSPLYMIQVKSKSRQRLTIGSELYGESGIYILEGTICEGSMDKNSNKFGAKQLLVAKDSSLCSLTMEKETTIYIFGGEPFPEERHIDWNFVSSDKEVLQAAKDKWKSGNWKKIPSDPDDFTPYPSKIPKK